MTLCLEYSQPQVSCSVHNGYQHPFPSLISAHDGEADVINMTIFSGILGEELSAERHCSDREQSILVIGIFLITLNCIRCIFSLGSFSCFLNYRCGNFLRGQPVFTTQFVTVAPCFIQNALIREVVNDMPVSADRQLVVRTATNIDFSVLEDIQNFALSA